MKDSRFKPHQIDLFGEAPPAFVAYAGPVPHRPGRPAAPVEEAGPWELAPVPASVLRECPASEQPRERLLASGARSLSETELVALLIDCGSGQELLPLARDLLARHGGLPGLPQLGAAWLAACGLTETQAARLLAAVELARRLARAAVPERRPLGQPGDVVAYLRLTYGARDQEVAGALFLDSRHRLLGGRELHRGVLDRAAIDPRETLKQALLVGAAAVVLFHTHPSGDPAPSAEDLSFTRRFHQAGEVVGVKLLDHLIIAAGGRWASLRERGAF